MYLLHNDEYRFRDDHLFWVLSVPTVLQYPLPILIPIPLQITQKITSLLDKDWLSTSPIESPVASICFLRNSLIFSQRSRRSFMLLGLSTHCNFSLGFGKHFESPASTAASAWPRYVTSCIFSSLHHWKSWSVLKGILCLYFRRATRQLGWICR